MDGRKNKTQKCLILVIILLALYFAFHAIHKARDLKQEVTLDPGFVINSETISEDDYIKELTLGEGSDQIKEKK